MRQSAHIRRSSRYFRVGECKSPHLNYPKTGVECHAQNREIKRVDNSKKYKYDDKIKIAAYYLRNKDGLVQVEENYMKLIGKKGWTSKSILNELGVDTSRKSSHKGLLSVSYIDTELLNATGTFKITLEEIKKRGL